ncbi:MAG: hypothetical protein HFG57_05595 [Lachnospiraceae bacterium]|jgi:hypothetical protein|nr:hypothetical protein [Lachnospiraceae bacterium]
MSFSVAVCQKNLRLMLHTRRKFQENKNKKIVTLQVRILKNNILSILYNSCGKKTFLSVSAALTLEAVMSLTLFIFATVCLMTPMKIMNTERKIQAVLEEMGEDFSQYAYIQNVLEKGKLSFVVGVGDFVKEFSRQMVSGVAQGYAQVEVMDHIDTKAITQIRMQRSQVLEDGETIDLLIDYEIRLPFSVLGLSSLERTMRCRRRAWIGKEGKDYGAGQGEEDPTVYIGKTSTRYHKSRSCHYLANNLTGVSLDKIEEMRNNSGGKYYPCSECGKRVKKMVYIMPSGRSYHSSKNCTAIIAYVRTVRLSEVKNMGACSYCGK